MSHGGGELWSVGEAGAYLGVSRATVYRLIGKGDLLLAHPGNTRRSWVLRSSVLALRDRAVSAATPPHGVPLGGTWGGSTWAPAPVGALEVVDGPMGPSDGHEGLEGTG